MIVNEGGGGKKLPTLTNPGTAANLLSGKQLINQNGEIVTGSMTDRGAVTQALNAGGSYAIPAGYHNGAGKVTANSLSSQTSGTATAADIRSGKTAWVNGTKITGTGETKQRVQFGFLCHGTYGDIEVYTEVAYSEEPDNCYIISAGSSKAWTFECTLGSVVVVYCRDRQDNVSGRTVTGFEHLRSTSTLGVDFKMSTFVCTSTNATIDVEK